MGPKLNTRAHIPIHIRKNIYIFSLKQQLCNFSLLNCSTKIIHLQTKDLHPVSMLDSDTSNSTLMPRVLSTSQFSTSSSSVVRDANVLNLPGSGFNPSQCIYFSIMFEYSCVYWAATCLECCVTLLLSQCYCRYCCLPANSQPWPLLYR